MSYNLSDPNKLPITLPVTDLSVMIGNTNGQCSFVDSSLDQLSIAFANNGDIDFLSSTEASGQYQFATFDSNNQLSLQNLNISIGDGLSGDNISSSNLSTTISLPDQPLFINLAYLVSDDGSVTIEVTDQGIIKLLESVPVLSANERLLQLEQRTQVLRNAVFGS